MKKEILSEAAKIVRQNGIQCFEQVEEILLGYLEKYPKDTDAWLLLLRIECNSPLFDEDRIIKYANNVLSYDPNNVYALLFLVYAYYFLIGEISFEIYQKLCLVHNEDPEAMAMIELAKAFYYKNINIDKYECALKKSSMYSMNQQQNLTMLGSLYLKQGKIKEGKMLIEQAIKNVKKIDSPYDPASLEDFFDEVYKGTNISSLAYNELKSLIL